MWASRQALYTMGSAIYMYGMPSAVLLSIAALLKYQFNVTLVRMQLNSIYYIYLAAV